MNDLKKEMYAIVGKVKQASSQIAMLDTSMKHKILLAMAKALVSNSTAIIKANKKDVSFAKKKGRNAAIIDRLTLNEKRIKDMAQCLKEIALFKDPVGSMSESTTTDNGLFIGKMKVPIGVVGIIYEARPNVTSDCVGLCIKSGNAIILRGGSESINSNLAIFDILNKAGKKCGLPENSIYLIETIDRKAVDVLLGMTGLIDVIIPRGGESLIKEVVKKAKVPVIKHYKGVCHVYVDEYADLNMANNIVMNAKVQRPGVCNAMETLLVHEHVAARFLPGIVKKLQDAGVEVRGDKMTKRIAKNIVAAKMSDWPKEYLDLIVSVKVVDDMAEAVEHIRKYGSSHSDAIVTDNYEHGLKFVKEVDSACVYINASTRFTDGNQFGKGAEMGISTDKLHARGPMGVEELTTYKYVVFGNGQIRE